MPYLCTRKTTRTTNFGAVVQLVRILACHARGRGFEPRPHRKEENQKWFSSFFVIPELMPCFYRNGRGAGPAPKEFLTTYQQKLTKWKSNVLKNFISSHRINNKKQSNMKKNYYYLAVALATGLLASCSNEITEEITPGINTEVSENLSTRAFPEDDGAKALSGMPAEKLWALLPGADTTFATTFATYGEMTKGQYNEIKEFADNLLAKEKNPSVARIHRVLFDWIVKNIKYADGYCSNEPYDVFTTKKAVCQGYANLLSVMARTQGLHIITVNGYMNHNNSFFGHAWNYVQLNNGDWWVSDPTNGILVKGEKLEEYKNQFLPMSADGNILENDLYAVNYTKESLNLNQVKVADESFMVPFSITLNDGKKHQITTFSPTVDLPETVKEIYLGTNIQSLGGDGTFGLRDHAPYVEAAYVDPNNKFLESHNGIVYQVYNDEPIYIPTGMKSVTLKFTETIGKNYLYQHSGVEEFHVPAGTKKIEAWAVEKCPNLKVAYVPTETEIDENAFVEVHDDFQIIRQDQTGIKDVIAD